ncbi:hypothetical protein DFQ27_003752 [Actinomortierella ambigua]|uniref:Myb-like domain-containing protein n=1 Tax=Actinomortierella ambigua TaxID=1343610 RepID=A0A9P6Q3W6_9FUNG|nr:hypothetical protein DFQ27_003752 [Actinomortierella ambigua]
MSTRTRRATRLASQSLEEKTVVDEVKREHANENIAPDAVESDTRVTSLKDTPKDLQAKPVLHEQDQNQTTNHDNKTPASPPGSPTEPLKRKLGRPLKVVKAEGAEAVTLQQEKTAKNEDEENDTDDKDEDDADDTEDVPEDPEDGEFTLRPKKQRIEQPRMVTPVLVAKEMSEYERMRLENIRKNEEMLLALQLPTMSMKLQADTIEGKQTDKPERDEPKKFAPMAGKKPKPPPKNVAPIIPARTSNRLRRLKPASDDESTPASEPAPAQSLRNEDVGDDDNDDDDDNIDQSKLMAADLYFDEETRKNAIRVDGHYTGWINGGVMERYGFEKNATEAWEANGGGTFTFKDPTGGGSGRSRKFNAKDFAKGMFKKNPNAYFYRHNEPGEDQWTGDWTEDERVLFLEVARKFGCGDKWGLFASHIPHRVGYQCSNYYRQVVLPEGLVFDPNYQFTSNGKPIYCGKYNQRR